MDLSDFTFKILISVGMLRHCQDPTNFSDSISCVMLVNMLDLYRGDWILKALFPEQYQLHNLRGPEQNENEGYFVKKIIKNFKTTESFQVQIQCEVTCP